MKPLICVTLLLAVESPPFSQPAKEKSALQSMVDTELAFARLAAERGHARKLTPSAVLERIRAAPGQLNL